MEREAFLSLVSRRLGSERSLAPAFEAPAIASPAIAAEELAALFSERAVEAGAIVHRAASRAAACESLGDLLEREGHDTLACPPSLRSPATDHRWTSDPREASFGLSEADWGIAETGSVVFRHLGLMGRQYSLVPPAVGVLLAASHIAPDLGAVLRLVECDAPPACVTFMSGISHSSDIAGTPCSGVHGPGSVHVWLLDDE